MLNTIIKKYGIEQCLDSLTKVYKREIIDEYINSLIENKVPFTVGIIDVDNFKYINDNYGHHTGDKILTTIVTRIRELLDKNCTVGRYGGDEFIIVLKNIVEYDIVWKILHRLNFGVNSLNIDNIVELSLSVTIGVSRFPLDHTTYLGLFDLADIALYRGKAKGRNCFIIYLPEKHGNIKLDTLKDKKQSSMFLHNQVSNILSSTFNLGVAVETLFKYLSNYLMFDHICLQTLKDIKYSVVHQLSPEKDFKYIDTELIRKSTNRTGLFYVNSKKSLEYQKSELSNLLVTQNIESTCYVEVNIYGRLYGHIRVDSVNGRIWQYQDMDLLVSAAKMIAIILFYQGKSLDNI